MLKCRVCKHFKHLPQIVADKSLAKIYSNFWININEVVLFKKLMSYFHKKDPTTSLPKQRVCKKFKHLQLNKQRKLMSDYYKNKSHHMSFLNEECAKKFMHMQLLAVEKSLKEVCLKL